MLLTLYWCSTCSIYTHKPHLGPGLIALHSIQLWEMNTCVIPFKMVCCMWVINMGCFKERELHLVRYGVKHLDQSPVDYCVTHSFVYSLFSSSIQLNFEVCSTKKVQHSPFFFCLRCLRKPNAPVKENGYHDDAYQLSFTPTSSGSVHGFMKWSTGLVILGFLCTKYISGCLCWSG